MNALLQQAAQRFPLVARPRPACLPLERRIAELHELSQTASHSSGTNGPSLAAEVLNKAALIASDCGVPAMARSLCWRHFNAYLPAWPLDASTARRALEPLVNLARLAIRDNDGARGYRLLHTLFHAVSNGDTADIDGHRIPFHSFVRTVDDLHTVRQWLWGVFLAEGIRALIHAGQWEQAVAHAQHYRGIGQRLLDGRQATIIAHCLAGQSDTAFRLVAESQLHEPWEHPVAGCLGALCNSSAGHPISGVLVEVQRQFLELDRTPGLLVFRTRLGLTLLDLVADTGLPMADRVLTSLISDGLTSMDGYVAREVLAHQRSDALLTVDERQELNSVMRDAGLGIGTIPAHLMPGLLSAVRTSELLINADEDTRSGRTVENHPL